MIAFLDTSQDLTQAGIELGCECAQLLTPLTKFRLRDPDGRFAIDNGAFSGFNAASFLTLLEREKSRIGQCQFVAVPDVVGSARRTLEVFDHWAPKLRQWPLALVAQDGIEDLPIPWDLMRALFIGGSTKFKLSDEAAAVVKAAKAMGIWVHAGRVNTPGRWEYFEELGADSLDGTGLARYSWMRDRIYQSALQPKLYDDVTGG